MSQQAKQLIAQAKAEGWKRLELGKCGLTDLDTQVPELFELTDLEELVLSNRWWDMDKQDWIDSANGGEINYLSQLPQAMSQLKQLKVLICGGSSPFNQWQISDYSVIQHLAHLTYLDLSSNKITRIENLDKLANLQQLDLSGNEITHIENLAELTNLQQFHISFNLITQIENLDKLPNLQQLDLSFNLITNQDNIANAGLPATCKIYI